jgi:hypothetical protein
VKRLVAWVGGIAGGIAAYRLLKRPPEPAPAPAEPDDRAEELKAKLAESRVAEPTVEEAPAEPEAEEPEPESPEDRRQRVHEEGRATLDDMKDDMKSE